MNRFLLVLASFICICCSSEDNLNDVNDGKASVYGTISDYTTGNTVSQATVELYTSAVISNMLINLVATSVTGTDGVYSFPDIKVPANNLSGDQYTIIVSHPKYKSYSRVLKIKYDSQLNINVALEPQ